MDTRSTQSTPSHSLPMAPPSEGIGSSAAEMDISRAPNGAGPDSGLDAHSREELEVLLGEVEKAAVTLAAQTAPIHPAFSFFTHDIFDQSTTEVLKHRSISRLAEIANQQWAFVQRKSTAEMLVKVNPPAGESGLASVQTCAADMPFLVDSVSLALREAGTAIDWLVHPVLRVVRTPQGEIDRVGEGAAESVIHAEFEPLSDESAYVRIENRLKSTLADLRRVVDDYTAIRKRLRAFMLDLENVPAGASAEEFTEARDFLNYLEEYRFTFLGYVESRAFPGPDGRLRFHTDSGTGLGLLRPDGSLADVELIAPQAELDKYAESQRLVVITKCNQISPIHRAELLDSISIKRLDANGTTIGTVRFIGLFSREVYIDRPRDIPLIRRKANYVIQAAQLPEHSHASKHLRDILHGLPREELFQSSEKELLRLCMGIRSLRDRQAIRLFVRRDRYGRFFSCMVFVPSERYSHELAGRIAKVLMEAHQGLSVEHDAESISGESLTRIMVRVKTPPGSTISKSVEEIEQQMLHAIRSWREQLRALIGGGAESAAILKLADSAPLSYQEAYSPEDAIQDFNWLRRLSTQTPILPRLILAGATPELRLYTLGSPMTLSSALPILENFGLDVLAEDPIKLSSGSSDLWIQRFDVRLPNHISIADAANDGAIAGRFEQAFSLALTGGLESDALNQLVLKANLDARQISLHRAISKYLIQTGLPFSEQYMIAMLIGNAQIAQQLWQWFDFRFNPERSKAADGDESTETERALKEAIEQSLNQVQSLDADRVLRAYYSVFAAMLRTNFYQTDVQGTIKPYVSFKLNPALIPELPLPRPKYEIWVYSPRVEGVHLRGGKVARGGLRWSDRRQDFRTEVLGLMKAQMVKNSVIVPVGAKGGFYVKKGPPASERDAWMANGIDCYKTFLRGLLDLTDNRVGEEIVPPAKVVRYDEDDSYLVVAADKGTATFSDIANGVAGEYAFWLGDAFASGGSAGYDHKKMGITARGAWESVKRHFRELGGAVRADGSRLPIDIEQEATTVVGIGDMSGDVFGNGLLLSTQLKLLAAFDHRHIFLDPNPDPMDSHAERERMFALPRSSWADYNATKISSGGGVYPRSLKQIAITPEVRAALGITAESLSPNDLIKAILCAPVDLLWNGGIGTYVKSASQVHADVGDRSNDAVRVNGRDLRARVVGEGGNLGFTQLGRIEYARFGANGGGGRINTDAIDNAGGVHCSDREVNIKIPLNQLMAEGRLTRSERDPLLAECTGDIVQFVLRDNYVQSAAISLVEASAAQRLEDHAELIRLLERDGALNRQIEFLPDDEGIKERRLKSLGLTRPEISVLLAYGKISLFDAIIDSELPDDPFFIRDLLANFPRRLIDRFTDAFASHRLKREIIATIMANAVVNRMGPGFAHLWAEDHGLQVHEVVKAYAIAHQIYDGDSYWTAIEAMDGHIPAALQYRLMNRAIGLLKHVTGWMTQSRHIHLPVQAAVDRFTKPIIEIGALLPEILPPGYREDWQQTATELAQAGVPDQVAHRIANTRALGVAPDVIELAEEAGASLRDAAEVYFLLGERLGMLWLYNSINELPNDDKWRSLSRVNLRDDAYRTHRQLARRVLAVRADSSSQRLDRWIASNERKIRVSLARLDEIRTSGGREFEKLMVAVRELRELRMK